MNMNRIVLLSESVKPSKKYESYTYDYVRCTDSDDVNAIRKVIDGEKDLRFDYVMGDMTGATDVLVFKSNGVIDAVVFLNETSKELMLLYIMSNRRGKGLCEKIVRTLVDDGIVDNLVCSVWNINAMRTYMKCGFVVATFTTEEYVSMKLHDDKFIKNKRGY